MKEKLLSLLLALIMLTTALPYSASADESSASETSSGSVIQSNESDHRTDNSLPQSQDNNAEKDNSDGAAKVDSLKDSTVLESRLKPLQNVAASDYKAKLLKHFSQYESFSSGLPVPYTGEDMIDLIKILRTEVQKAIGKEANISVEKFDPWLSSTYQDWSSGEKLPIDLRPEVVGNENTSHRYFKNNEPYKFFRVNGMKVIVDGEVIDFKTIKENNKELSFHLSIGSKVRTPQEVVEFEADQYPKKRIIAGNPSLDRVTTPLGEAGWQVVLPNKSEVYDKVVDVGWKLEHKDGSEAALALKDNRTTILRPNVGEKDAKFSLIAVISSKEDSNVKQEKNFDVSIPAFDAQKIPIRILPGSKLIVKDPYYKNVEVNSKYIESNADGSILTYTLHANEKDLAQTYYYEISKEGHLSRKGSFQIIKRDGEHPILDLRLTPSNEKDTDLKDIKLLEPLPGTAALKKNIEPFESNTLEYTAEVGGVSYVKLKIDRALPSAEVKVTRYASEASANKEEFFTSSLSSNGEVICYLPNELKDSAIKIEVLPPSGSVLTQSKTYTIKIKKSERPHSLSNVQIKTISSTNGVKSNALSEDGIPPEERFSPPLNAGGIEKIYQYPVNYVMDKVEITPSLNDKEQLSKIEVDGQELDPNNIVPVSKELKVGDNPVLIRSTFKDNTNESYHINIRRKAELKITSFSVTGGYVRKPASSDWTGQAGFPHDAKEIEVIVNANDPSAEVILTNLNTKEVSKGLSGKALHSKVDDSSTVVFSVTLKKEVDNTIEGVRYIIGFYRDASGSPNAVESYLPAPGQFVNKPVYGNPKATLSMASNDIITLGAYGGNIVWHFDQPITDEPNNPYGIDFIIFGNVFRNQDGSSAEGAAEPAAVMVSQDGNAWYELAGSQYYDASTIKNAEITYRNPDSNFVKAEPIPWKIQADLFNKQDIFHPNSYHNQPYYPNPATYSQFQNGIGKNDSYSASEVRFKGNLIETDDSIVFGYADAHANSENKGALSKAVNPYSRNHTAITNGDGFDLAWAVDSEGKPVKLNGGIKYIKTYNAVMNIGSFGEKSPEISGILRAQKSDRPVGKSRELTELLVNGNKVELKKNLYEYDVNIGDSKSIQITPSVSDASKTNIYVSNRWVASGATSQSMLPVQKTRIIVQNDDKEPIIYILNIQSNNLPPAHAEPKHIRILPDNIMAEKDSSGIYKAEIPYSTSAVKISVPPLNKDAKVEINGKPTTESNDWVSEDSFSVAEGAEVQIPVKIVSADQSIKNDFVVKVKRGTSPAQPSPDTIQVTFRLIGAKGTPNNIWIAESTHTIPRNSSVKFITEKLLIQNNIPFVTTHNGTYISSINGLAELQRGPNSGWMYRVNGVIPNVGFAQKILQNGDTVQWFYTDDYTKESGYEPWNPSPGGGGGSSGSKDSSSKPTEIPNSIVPLADVQKHWTSDAIAYAVEKGLLGTVDGKSFAPDLNMTRAMFVTVLFRMDGEPKTTYKNIYKDVKPNLWYSESVSWASAKGLVKGIGANVFGPQKNITREQLAVFMMRYAQYKGLDTGARGDLTMFKDIGQNSLWAKDALSWAVANHLLSGRSENKMEPKAYTTRAEIAAILMRFNKMLEKE